VSVALLSLEMKQLVRQLPGKMFVCNRRGSSNNVNLNSFGITVTAYRVEPSG
jgi:hypothetical protein